MKFCNFAYFSRALFYSSFSFENVEFQSKAFFSKSKFEEEVSFSSVFFLKNAGSDDFQGAFEFQGAFFSGGVIFSDTNRWGKSHIPWSRAFFDAKTSGALSFVRSPLPPLSAFHGLKLDNGALLSFDDPGTMATLASFSEQLSRIKAKPKKSSTSKEKLTPDQANRLLDDLAGGCRVLKKYFESQGDRERSQRFFRLELEARMKSDEVGRLERLIFWAYRWSSDYGASIGRPLARLACSVPCFAILYWIIAAACLSPISTQTKPIGEPYPIQTISEVSDRLFKGHFSQIDAKPMLGALSFSAHRAFPFGAWDVKAEEKDNNMRKLLLGDGEGVAHFTVRVLATIQSIFSIAMIFLSGLAIRRRFKMD